MKKIIEDLLKVALKFSRAGMVTAAELAAIKRAQAAIRPGKEPIETEVQAHMAKLKSTFEEGEAHIAAKAKAIDIALANLRPKEEIFFWFGGKISDQAPQ